MTKWLPGYRIIKTVIAVFICLMIADLLGMDTPYFGAIAAVIVMKSSPKKSLAFGKSRLIGTLFGGVFASLFVVVSSLFKIPDSSIIYALLVSLVLLLDLSVVKILGFDEHATSLSAILVLSVLISHSHDMQEMLSYVTIRMIETLIGCIVAILVNISLFNKEAS